MSPLTRRESMVKALEDAGPRGCSRRELMSLGGTKWKDHLRRVEETYYVRRCRSRFSSETWRWVLLGERLPEPAGESCPLPTQLPLITPSGRPAVDPPTLRRAA